MRPDTGVRRLLTYHMLAADLLLSSLYCRIRYLIAMNVSGKHAWGSDPFEVSKGEMQVLLYGDSGLGTFERGGPGY